jgi:hypothetical protein
MNCANVGCPVKSCISSTFIERPRNDIGMLRVTAEVTLTFDVGTAWDTLVVLLVVIAACAGPSSNTEPINDAGRARNIKRREGLDE